MRYLLPALLVCAFALPASAMAAPGCQPYDYSYAGYAEQMLVHGIAATVSVTSTPTVANGHVAAWVGIGGEGLGPNGADEWLQVGVGQNEGGALRLYSEAVIPNGSNNAKTIELGEVKIGERHRVGMQELPGRPGWWQSMLDGRPVSPAYHLPDLDKNDPEAIGESYVSDMAACNRFAFRLGNVKVATVPGGGWQPFAPDIPFNNRGFNSTWLSSSLSLLLNR